MARSVGEVQFPGAIGYTLDEIEAGITGVFVEEAIAQSADIREFWPSSAAANSTPSFVAGDNNDGSAKAAGNRVGELQSDPRA